MEAFKGVRSGVERRRGVSGLKAARGDGRRDPPGDKVLKDETAFTAPTRPYGDQCDTRTRLTPQLHFSHVRRVHAAQPKVDHFRKHDVVHHRVGVDRHEDVFILVAHADAVVKILRVVPYKAMSGWSSKASGGVQRQRGRGLNARCGRRETPAKDLKDRRSPRRRGRMGTSVR